VEELRTERTVEYPTPRILTLSERFEKRTPYERVTQHPVEVFLRHIAVLAFILMNNDVKVGIAEPSLPARGTTLA
jgi:hypothetical protein